MLITKWTFLEGFYFWFISFTTIGFGDYLPKQARDISDGSEDDTELKVKQMVEYVFNSFWYTLGMCMVSSVISSIQAALDKNRSCQRCRGCFSWQRRLIDTDSAGVTDLGSKRDAVSLEMSFHNKSQRFASNS